MPNKTELARILGVSRRSLYYTKVQEKNDWKTKQLIESALRDHPAYGHKRLAQHLHINKKRVLRVMKIYGSKPYRRTAKKRFVSKQKDSIFPNFLLAEIPRGRGDIYASDFTYIKFQGRWVYVATVLDVYTREIVGVSVLMTHATQLVMNALGSAVLNRPPPRIIHSDQGSEYASKDYAALVEFMNIQQSMSKAGCPWENGYQESFYKGFRLDLGDPNRFETLGELVAEIYKTINYYNRRRIHSALGMSPIQFARQEEVYYN